MSDGGEYDRPEKEHRYCSGCGSKTVHYSDNGRLWECMACGEESLG